MRDLLYFIFVVVFVISLVAIIGWISKEFYDMEQDHIEWSEVNQ